MRPSIMLLAMCGYVLATTLAADEPTDKRKLEPATCGTIQQVHKHGNVFLAGQPSAEDFKTMKELGIKKIVNLRTAGEIDLDEEKLARAHGMEYIHIPFKSPDTLTDKVFDRGRLALKQADKGGVMMHCGSANRVGALWLVHRVLDHNVDFEQAHKEAKTVGLRTPEYTERAKEYISKNR